MHKFCHLHLLFRAGPSDGTAPQFTYFLASWTRQTRHTRPSHSPLRALDSTGWLRRHLVRWGTSPTQQ